ncbi:MAG: hypothetical protein KAT71_08100 [Gammaproteobacteria bacterium]|nr:hypothetical protein [Gammaproteobacteria bacterium]
MTLIKQKQVDGLVTDLDAKVDVGGDTMTGDLILNADPTVALGASTKQYVDNKVASSVEYQGGYNASTNTPDLDTSPSGVTTGDMYTVTVAGTFFTQDLEVGDVLISEQDNPTVLADWTVVNKDLDASSIKISYESNADTNAYPDADVTKMGFISVTQAVDLDTMESNIATNNAKVSNVSTALSAGTVTATTYGITSDGGADDIVLPEATTTVAGLLGADKWDEIVANTAKTSNATHTGDVTGDTALTLESVAITGQTVATAVGADYMLISDTGSAGVLKKALVSDVLGGSVSIIEEDDACPVTALNTNFNITLGTAPTGGIAGVVSVAINGVSVSAGELISITTTTMVLNVPYAVDASDTVTTRYF